MDIRLGEGAPGFLCGSAGLLDRSGAEIARHHVVTGDGDRVVVDELKGIASAHAVDARARHDDARQAGSLVPLDDNGVHVGVAREHVHHGDLVFGPRVFGVHVRRDQAHMTAARLRMAPGILAGLIDVEALVAMVLDGSHAHAALGETRDDLLHQRGLAGVLVSHKGDGGRRRACARAAGKRGGELGGDDLGFLCLGIDRVGMGAFPVALPEAGTPAFLSQQANIDDFHTAVNGLAHVIDGEAGGRRGCERLHLDAGHAGHTAGREHVEAHAVVVARGCPAGGRDCRGRDGFDFDFRLGDVERVAHGDEVARALTRHDACDARACEDVALFGAVLEHHGLGLGVHEDGALGDCDSFGDLLVSHIDHAHVAVLIHMREIVAVGVALAGGDGSARRAPRLGGA